MNKSHLYHIAAALLVQVSIALHTGNWMACAAAGTFLFSGRELTQAEYRYIDANGGKRYETPYRPDIASLHPRWWNLDSVLDVVLPLVVVVAVAWGVEQ